jgi:TRAP-type C4-dicarboxylate transport system substrate-binding protein
MSATGCTGSAPSKAGGASPPLTLRIGTNDEPGRPAARAIEEFARQVTTLSHGRIRIDPVYQVAGDSPSWDQVVARQVINGQLDMGMIPARAWDTEKVTSLRPLQAPFLVDSDGLLKQVVTADLAGEMLAGLDRAGVTGLALVPESTRHLFGYGTALLSPVDLHGRTIRVPRSTTSYALFQALGATPNDVDDPPDPFVGADSSFELAVNLERSTTATGNLPLYAKANSVVINSKRFTALDQTQRGRLRDAAIATRDWGVRSMSSTAADAKQYCLNGGSVALATPAEVAAFRQAAQPVYTELQKDPQTAALIAAIRGLAARTPPSPPVAACGPAPAASSVQPAAGTFPDGIYRKTVSEKAMLAAGVSGRDAKNHAGLWTMTFDKGTVAIQQRGYPAGTGVYCLSAGQVTVTEGRSRCGATDGRVLFTAAWQLDHDQLRFTATAGDNDAPPGALTNTLFGGEPWTKIN